MVLFGFLSVVVVHIYLAIDAAYCSGTGVLVECAVIVRRSCVICEPVHILGEHFVRIHISVVVDVGINTCLVSVAFHVLTECLCECDALILSEGHSLCLGFLYGVVLKIVEYDHIFSETCLFHLLDAECRLLRCLFCVECITEMIYSLDLDAILSAAIHILAELCIYRLCVSFTEDCELDAVCCYSGKVYIALPI